MTNKKQTWKHVFTISVILLIIILIIIGPDIIFPQDISENYTEEKIDRIDFSFIDDYQYGTNPNASVHIIMFGDYQCPFTAETIPVINQLLDNYNEKINANVVSTGV